MILGKKSVDELTWYHILLLFQDLTKTNPPCWGLCVSFLPFLHRITATMRSCTFVGFFSSTAMRYLSQPPLSKLSIVVPLWSSTVVLAMPANILIWIVTSRLGKKNQIAFQIPYPTYFFYNWRAAVPIKKGEHISIMYSDPMWGTANRQTHLYETKYFHCRYPHPKWKKKSYLILTFWSTIKAITFYYSSLL